MIRLANAAIRRPAVALTASILAAAVLVVLGFGLDDRLSPTMTSKPGTEATQAQEVAEAEFGPSTLVPILLVGPRDQVDRQGPVLVRSLARRPDTRVLSAWDAGEVGSQLRPSPREAMIVASVARDEEALIDGVQDEIDATVDRVVRGDVRAHVTGQPTLDAAIQDEALDTARQATLIALPILFLALLLLLRAPLAALAGTAFGGTIAFAAQGVLTPLAEDLSVDGIGVALTAVMGLALGTAFAVLMLSRFRGEREQVGGSPHAAALAASQTVAGTGRAVLVAGTGLFASLLLAAALGPADNLRAIGAGVFVSTLLATGAAVVTMPALLTLLDGRMFAWSFGAPYLLTAPWRWLQRGERVVLRRALPAAIASILVLVALAIPALGMETGPPDPSFLPEDSPARQDFEAVQRAMGPGWPTPYNVVVVSRRGPVTGRALLRQLERFQARIARDPRVESVTGPGAFRAKTADLGTLERQLDESSKLLGGAGKDLAELEGGLGQAGSGALQLQGALGEASAGAGKLAGGGSDAQDGARQLRDGLAAARAGSARISAGLESALSGATSLQSGAGDALAGANTISGGLGDAAAPVKQGIPLVSKMANDVAAASTAAKGASASSQTLTGQLDSALAALSAMTDGKQDPSYAAVADALAQARQSAAALGGATAGLEQQLGGASLIATAFAGQLPQLSAGLEQLYAGSTELSSGIARLRTGNAALAGGIEKLSGGQGDLTGGLGQLRDGADELEAGLGLLSGGAGELAGGLGGGVPKVGQLASGLGTMKSGVTRFRGNLPSTKDLEKLQAQSPGLFDSGYFVLAAIEGATPSNRNQATFLVNLGRGGNAAQIAVIPREASSSDATQALGDDLRDEAAAFGESTGTETAVGGPAGEVTDFDEAIGADIPIVVLGIAITIALLLMIALRSVPLALATVAFNLLTAAAVFGVLALLTTGDDPVLGGPGYIDALQAIETFAAVFGIALVFEVLLLQRARELYVAEGDAHGSLALALHQTAGAATGAAAVMVAAIVPFVASGLFNLRLTIGLAIAILIDALIVRPVLLPATVALLGDRAWWPTRAGGPHRMFPDAPAAHGSATTSGNGRRRHLPRVRRRPTTHSDS